MEVVEEKKRFELDTREQVYGEEKLKKLAIVHNSIANGSGIEPDANIKNKIFFFAFRKN